MAKGAEKSWAEFLQPCQAAFSRRNVLLGQKPLPGVPRSAQGLLMSSSQVFLTRREHKREVLWIAWGELGVRRGYSSSSHSPDSS